jgi:hypothetical protein
MNRGVEPPRPSPRHSPHANSPLAAPRIPSAVVIQSGSASLPPDFVPSSGPDLPIDCVVALAMAVEVAAAAMPKRRSAYEDRDLIVA